MEYKYISADNHLDTVWLPKDLWQKRLPRRFSEIAIQFKCAPHLMFQNTAVPCVNPNLLVMHLQPEEGISLRFEAKVPGPLVRSDLLAPPGRVERPWKPLKAHAGGGDLAGLIRQLVRVGVETLPEGDIYDQIVKGVEQELIEHVLEQCDGIQVKAAKRLGVNRNTLHKKVDDYHLRRDESA